jgi:GNAT superfamily N-acetyltransferase
MHVTIVPYSPAHASGLAAMFNASDKSWPWGFGGGLAYTPERAAEFMEESNSVLDLIALSGDEVVGLSLVRPDPRRPGTGFISLLNVRPDWHGKGIGRRLLVQTITMAAALGYSRLDLMTWPANLKAVPLYKKTGFFWVPDTNVTMHNYLPHILNQEWAQEFFRRHYWYRHLERDLKVAPDDQRWHGMKVCIYRWQVPGDELEVVIDAESGGITAITTPRFSVSCRVEAQRPAPGDRVAVTWSARGITTPGIPLVARGEAGLLLDFAGTVPTGSEIRAEVQVASDADPTGEKGPPPALSSRLVVEGQAIDLRTGLRVTAPARLEVWPAHTMRVEEPTPVWVGLVNQREEPLVGRLHLDYQGARPSSGIPVLEVNLGPWERLGTGLVLTPEAAGPVRLEARLEHPGDGRILWREAAALGACAPGGAVAYINPRTAHLESESLRVEVGLTGQLTEVHDAVSGKLIAYLSCDRLGPPYYPSEFTSRRASVHAGLEGQLAVLYLEAASETYPGLVLRRRLALHGAHLELDTELVNAASTPYQLSVFRPVWPQDVTRLTIPLRAGLVCQEMEAPAFPAWEGDFPEDDWAETWLAVEHTGGVLGLLWEGRPEVDAGGFTFTEAVTIPAQGKTAVSRLRVVSLPGDWPAVRQLYWQRRPGKPRSPHRPAPVRRVYLHDELDQPAPPALALVGAPGERVLTVENLRRHPLDAPVHLEVGPGWEVSPRVVQVSGACYDHPSQAKVHLTPPGCAAATWLRASVELMAQPETHLQALIRPASPGQVSIEESSGLFTVDNGRLRLVIAPDCVGGLVSLRHAGSELLRSSYPEAGRYDFMKPWHGGMHPVLRDDDEFEYPGCLYRNAGPGIPCTVSTGFHWQGVEVGGRVSRRELRGLKWHCRYLTLPASNLVAIAYRVHNPTTAPFILEGMGLMAFWGLPEATVVLPDGRRRRAGQQRSELIANGWLRLECPGCSVVLAGTGSYELSDNPGSGLSLDWSGRKVVPPGSDLELVWYLAVADDPDQAGAYSTLAALGRIF